MWCLGIESTAHTFAAGVVSLKGKVVADVRDMYRSEKGIVPAEAAEHHRRVCDGVVRKALGDAEKEVPGVAGKIGLVAFSHGPGLSPCLHVGMKAAREFAADLGVPLIGVNHPAAHLTSGQLFTGAKDPVFLYISGANTQVVTIDHGHFRICGETLDIGLGNALDKFGREIGLGFPAGPGIEQLALKGKYVKLPYVVKGMDGSFSGLVTKCAQLVRQGVAKEDVCCSLQETAFAMLAEIAERALAHTEKEELLVIGGVAANKRLAGMLKVMCEERGAVAYAVPLRYAGDNGVMIAWQGLLEYQAGRRDEHPDLYPYERVEDVKVIWG